MNEPIGIIAGSGQFPELVAKQAKEAGFNPIICGFISYTNPELTKFAQEFKLVHLGQFGKVVEFFNSHNVKRLCFAGAISKPKALDMRPDFLAAKILFSLRHKGDDTLLRAVMSTLEKEGFAVCSAADFAQSLRCPPGLLSKTKVNADFKADIEFGLPIAQGMGSYDIGQCLVVKRGIVIAVECLEGTDATLIRGGELGGSDCIAIKIVKPGQDERVDLPSIGLRTIEILTRYKYLGLAVQAHKTLFFDRETALKLADQNKLSVMALDQL